MKHFATEEWIDFVNETMPNTKREEMLSHLNEGCPRCVKQAGMWQRVQRAAAGEKSYQPPEGSLRIAKATFAASRLAARSGKKRNIVELLFDSFQSAAPEGARSAGSGTRQILYRAEPYQIDLQIEGTPHSARLVVTGQLLDLSHAETVARRVPLLLSNARGNTVRMVTNEFGEFAGVIEDSGNLELSFVGKNYRPVVIALRDSLGGKAAGAASRAGSL